LLFGRQSLRITAPDTAQRAPFEKDLCSYTWAVMNCVFLNIGDNSERFISLCGFHYLLPEFCINNLEWLLKKLVMSDVQLFYHTTINTIRVMMNYKKIFKIVYPSGVPILPDPLRYQALAVKCCSCALDALYLRQTRLLQDSGIEFIQISRKTTQFCL
jgi:hypothetical protein